MSLETARSFFLWCSIINYALLLLWTFIATIGRRWWYGPVGRIFPISREQFDVINYAGIALYKMGVLLLNVVPFIACYLIK
jgi:hypothetical protein